MKIKLLPDQLQKHILIETMERFNQACNYISNTAFEHKTASQVKLHHLVYYDVRERFDLSAQMTVRAIGKVAEAYKRDKNKHHQFKPRGAMVYDSRLYHIKSADRISILTLKGRQLMPFVFCNYRNLDMDIRRVNCQADLVFQDDTFYLIIVVDVPEPPEIKVDDHIGVDLGIINVATDSDGEIHTGGTINGIRNRYFKIRQKLQSKGTRSAKRKFKKRRRKESNFVRNVNHIISKHIVEKAKDTGRGIALEDLSGIRDRITVRKGQRRQQHAWSFHQLRTFIEYKSKLAGVPLTIVSAKYSSQECSRCGHVSKSNRKSQSEFTCVVCGFSDHADHNAAVNIGRRAVVNQPNVACDDAEATIC